MNRGASVDFQLRFYSSRFIALDSLALHKQFSLLPPGLGSVFLPLLYHIFDCYLVGSLITFNQKHNYAGVCLLPSLPFSCVMNCFISEIKSNIHWHFCTYYVWLGETNSDCTCSWSKEYFNTNEWGWKSLFWLKENICKADLKGPVQLCGTCLFSDRL